MTRPALGRRRDACGILGVLPLCSTLVVLQLSGDRSISLEGFILYLGVISPLAIAIALLLLFVGPLVLLGAASEEVVRAFLLSRVWRVWPSSPGKLAAIVVSAGAFGLIHAYQGAVHVAWAILFGVIMALHYVRFGRVVPLVLAHYVTNALQIVVFALRAG